MSNTTRWVYRIAGGPLLVLLWGGAANGQTHIRGAVGPFQGMCFDALYDRAEDGAPIILYPCHEGANQQWSFASDGTIRGTVRAFQTMCFDAWMGSSDDGTSIRLHPCHGGANQQWTLTSEGTIRGKVGSFQATCFDAWLGSPASGTNIRLHPCHGGQNQKWVLERTPGAWKKIGGPAGALYGNPNSTGVAATNPQTGDLWYWDQSSWTRIGGPGRMFALGGGIYGLSPDASGVWQWQSIGGIGKEGSWKQIGGPASNIYAGSGLLYATNPQTGDLWRWNGTPMSWSKIGGPGKAFAVGDLGVYRLAPDGSGISKYSGTGQVWNEIGGPASAIYGGGELYATNPQTGDLWRWNGTPMSWSKIGGPGKAFAVGAVGVYRLAADGSTIWKYSGQGDVWNQVGGPAGLISASASTLYATNPETKDVWAYTPPPPPEGPTVTLTADPPAITVGQYSSIAWSSTNTISCNGESGIETGGKTSGSVNVFPTATRNYYLSCKGYEVANAGATVTVTVTGPSMGPVQLVGVYHALNVGTKPQPVSLLVSGVLQISAGSGGRTSFTDEKREGTLPAGTGQLPAVAGQIPFTITNLQRGTWKITVKSSLTPPVVCEVPLPVLSAVFNATGTGTACS